MKKIADIYYAKIKQPVFSFEFFPPKNEAGEESLKETLRELAALRPDFVSVTYGAGGSTQGRTTSWVDSIQEQHDVVSMAHYTCIGTSRSDVEQTLQEFAQRGIKNIMALRGDLPKNITDYKPPVDGFQYANELIDFIKKSNLGFSIGGACYPEVHQEAPSAAIDLDNLKRKVDSGAEFLISQLFFDNKIFLEFVERCRKAGIEVPIVPGIMPITSFPQIERFTQMAACSIPVSLTGQLSDLKDDPVELRKVSMDFSIKQCRELLAAGAPGIHFYTLNKSKVTRQILASLEG